MRTAGVRHRCSGSLLVPAILAVAASFPGTASAGTGVWTMGGPIGGGSIFALVIDPASHSTIYAGESGSGVFKSTDSGHSWEPASSGLTNLAVVALAIDPVTPTTLYAGTARSPSGVCKSTDSGASWTSAGLDGKMVYVLAVDPTTPTTVYAGTWYGGGVFKSTDAGSTWSGASAGLQAQGIVALKIDPASPSTLYVGTDDGIFKSVDSGESWTDASAGLPNRYVLSLAIDPAHTTTLYAGTENRFGGPADGLSKSTDSGTTWAATGLKHQKADVLAIDPTNPGTLYAAQTYLGVVFRSTDSGGTWVVASNLGDGHDFLTLAVDPVVPSTLHAGMRDSGVFTSTDSGSSWSVAGLMHQDVSALAVDPTAPATIYAGTNDSDGGDGGARMFRSTDSGDTWDATGLRVTVAGVTDLVVDPAAPTTIYAGTSPKGVFKSTDSGVTWAAANSGLTDLHVLAMAIDPGTPSTIYAGTDPGGVFKSTNAGTSWVAANAGLTNRRVYGLTIDPTNPARIYAATGKQYGGPVGAVFRSTDSGGSWATAGATDPEGVWSLAIDPATPSTVYAGTWSRILKSTDSGSTWAAVKLGVSLVEALVIDPSSPSTLYATCGQGVLKSVDSGASWDVINAGLTSLEAQALVLDPRGATTLHAGFSDRSVWQLSPCTAPRPTAVVSGSATVCAGDSTPIQAVLTGAGPWSLTWSDGVAQKGITASPAVRSVRPSNARTYTVVDLIDSSCGAQGSDLTGSAAVTLRARPTAVVSGSGTVCVGASRSIQASLTGTGPWNVTWSDGEVQGGVAVSPAIRVVAPASTTTYTVTALADSTCAASPGDLGGGALVTVESCADGSRFHTVSPCRLLDTREPTGALGGPALAPGQTRVFVVANTCGIPVSARAISANVTATQPTQGGFLTLFPGNSSQPLASHVNFRAGQTRANNAVLSLSTDGAGSVAIFNGSSGSADVILDVNGYFE